MSEAMAGGLPPLRNVRSRLYAAGLSSRGLSKDCVSSYHTTSGLASRSSRGLSKRVSTTTRYCCVFRAERVKQRASTGPS